MRLTNLDIDVLRTFVTGVELGSFAKAADRLGRSASAVSLHLRRLEDLAGRPVLHKRGRGLVPTEAGEVMLGYARRLLILNDEAVDAVRGEAIAGTVRLGLPQDFAEGVLPPVLARFAAAHPAVRVEVGVERTATLRDGIEAGRFDIALFWDPEAASAVARVPMTWLGPRDGFRRDRSAPLPLVAFEAPCLFRAAGHGGIGRGGRSLARSLQQPRPVRLAGRRRGRIGGHTAHAPWAAGRRSCAAAGTGRSSRATRIAALDANKPGAAGPCRGAVEEHSE